MIHHKKIKAKYFEKVMTGKKPYELRINDCDYRVGDFIVLNELQKNGYTGRWGIVKIVDMFEDHTSEFLQDDIVVLTVEPCAINPRLSGCIYEDSRYKEASDGC